jgi:hypothetical protein
MGEYQCRFRSDRSTTDQIFTLRQTLEKCHKHGIDLHLFFIDFKQAFDSVNRKEIYEALEDFGIPHKLIRLLKMTLQKAQVKVMIGNQLSKSFDVTYMVRQGDALSATLFNLILHKIIQNIEVTGTIVNKSKQILGYADDIVLVGRNITALQELFIELEKEGKKVGLNINEDKIHKSHKKPY